MLWNQRRAHGEYTKAKQKMKLTVLLLANFLVNSSNGQPIKPAGPLLILTPSVSLNTSYVCKGIEIVSCDVALVNWTSINTFNSIILPTGEILDFNYTVENGNIDHKHSQSSTYKSDGGSEGVITYGKTTLYGHFQLSGGKDFKVESLHDLQHVVWAEVDQSAFKDEHQSIPADFENDLLPMRMRMEDLLRKGKADTHTVVEFSVTVYYTKEFKDAIADHDQFIYEVIGETNRGYINSRIPARVKLHCTVQLDIPDGLDSKTTLNIFEQSEPNLNKLRKSADATILLVNHLSGACGINYHNAISSGRTVGVVDRKCALDQFSFGHEIAHGFGLEHQRRFSKSRSHPYAYGYVMERSSYSPILAYETAGSKRVNYYSSPNLRYRGFVTGTPENDNARHLEEVRFAVANIGDESNVCEDLVKECRDQYKYCPKLSDTCWDVQIKEKCPVSCGSCRP